MRTTLRALAALAVLGIFGCGQKAPEPKPLPAPPSIKSFTADKARITAGESVTLSFEAENATSAELIDQAGEKIELTGSATQGSATVTPAATSAYVLKVSGEGGRASRFVQVAVDEDLAEVVLVAVPPSVEAGQSAQLLWSAANASAATIKVASGGELAIDAAQGSGVVDVTPAQSESYSLEAQGTLSGTKTATATISVRPVLVSAAMAPAAANVGEELAFTWVTRGAAEVSISEKTFGEIHQTTDASAVASGTFSWTVPDQLPNSTAVTTNFPLEFTLVVKQANPDVTLTQVFPSFVGDGPAITTLIAPAAVTVGHDFDLSWTTLNATRIQVFAGGKLIFEPLPRDTASVTNGKITLPAPLADTTYELVAFGHEGTSVKKAQLVKVVQQPTITEFNLTGSVANAGDAATASWKTQDATAVTLRVVNGLNIYATSDSATVAEGTTQVRPGVRTRFVLEAWNDAGEVAREVKVVDVTNPGTFSTTPGAATPGGAVTVSWALDPNSTAQVFGDVTQAPVRNNPAIDPFNDLAIHADARELSFVSNDDAVARVPVAAGFTFPLAGISAQDFFVSTNGFVSFEDTGARASNLALNSTTTLPAVIAPFWDDLTFGDNGKVHYLLEGAAFPRTLIVQWSDVETKADGNSSLTFQVQLHETGEVRFVYSTLSGTNAAGESASIGWRADVDLNNQLGTSGAPILTAGEEAIFFHSGAITGQYTREATQSSVFALVARLTSGDYVVYPGAVNVVDPAWVAVNEAMVIPEGTATSGQWVELKNFTDFDVDLTGVELTTTTTPTSFLLPEGTVLPAGGFLMLGQSKDLQQNGGVHVDVEWGTTFAPDGSADDTLSLMAGSSPLSTIAYTAATLLPGVSLQGPDRSTITSAGASPTCAPTSTFGANGAKGTPFAENDNCFEYARASIPVNYFDISLTGTPLFTPGSSNMDIETKAVDLTTTPFTYFGAAMTTMTVSSNGFLVFGSSSSYDSNDTKPDTSPAGAVALFWDDLDNVTGGEGNAFTQYFAANEVPSEPRAHRIVQWHRFTHYTSTPANEDDLNFQAKLFDDGTVEFHYGTMTSGTSNNYANGNPATIWLANPSGAAASVIGINQPVLQPNTAYRFSPKP